MDKEHREVTQNEIQMAPKDNEIIVKLIHNNFLKMQIKTILRIHFLYISLATIKNYDTKLGWQGYGERNTIVYC